MSDQSGLVLLVLRFGSALLLYAFLAWSLLIIWRDLMAQSHQIITRLPPAILLSYEDQDTQLRFSLPQVYLGRDPICECHLEDETVSSKHARLSFRQNQWWIEDLDSHNGTFLNEQKLEIPTALAEGDQIRCGGVVFNVWFDN
jgi:pSer/pThr/pTyr-binding forkhead associated (FHA) protein